MFLLNSVKREHREGRGSSETQTGSGSMSADEGYHGRLRVKGNLNLQFLPPSALMQTTSSCFLAGPAVEVSKGEKKLYHCSDPFIRVRDVISIEACKHKAC